MKNRLYKSIPNKFVSVGENVDVSDIVQARVDCNTIDIYIKWYSPSPPKKKAGIFMTV